MAPSLHRPRARVVGSGVLVFAVAVFAGLLVPALAATGDLTYMGCVAYGGVDGCEQPAHASLRGAEGVAVSRDGKSVYVAANDAITWFKRRSSGALADPGCIADGGDHGCETTRHRSLSDVSDLAVSRDGKSLYAVAYLSKSITRFKRHSNGALTYKGCVANRGAHGCKKPRHSSLGDAEGVAVSRDGKSVYVASATHSAFRSREGGNSITRFKRRSNGALRYRGCIANLGAHGCRRPRHNSLHNASEVAVSPDGKSVYVVSTPGITVFKRAANGALAYRGCIANQGHHGCEEAAHRSLRLSRGVAVSPDGDSLYVASRAAITDFRRAAGGGLTYDECIANRGSHDCQAPVHDSLSFPTELAVSRDGESVYVASAGANSITDLKRASDGTLTYGDCFASEGAFGCEAPAHDSLGRGLGVAVSRDGRSVYVATTAPSAITLFSREISGP